MKLKWEPILEARDEETGEDTCYSAMLFPEKSGADRFLWIEKTGSDTWGVFNNSNSDTPLVTCKSLASAKRWVSTQYSAEIAWLSKRSTEHER